MSRGRFYFRPEGHDWGFVESLTRPLPFDAAIVSDRYLAPFPSSDPHCGQPADRLAMAFSRAGAEWALDPDTARLGQPRSADRQALRAAGRGLARAVQLPLTAETLAVPDAAQALVEAAAASQLGCRVFAVPYLEVDGVDDPRFLVNLDLVRRSQALAGDKAVAAFLQVRLPRVVDGTASRLAQALADSGLDVLFIRVRGFTPEKATPDEVEAYGGLVMRAAGAGPRVIADCVGRLGPVLVAAGADGFSSGTRWSRKVPDDLHPASSGGGGSAAMSWDMPVMSAPDRAAGASARCVVDGCEAPVAGVGDNRAIRIHNLHEFHRQARLAGREGRRYSVTLAADPRPEVRGWAVGLQRLERLAA